MFGIKGPLINVLSMILDVSPKVKGELRQPFVHSHATQGRSLPIFLSSDVCPPKDVTIVLMGASEIVAPSFEDRPAQAQQLWCELDLALDRSRSLAGGPIVLKCLTAFFPRR